MGITHKLKPEIREFVLDTQKNNLKLSCRGIASLVYEKFQVKISKSSINALIKGSGLSMPVGRRRVGPFKETPIKKVIETAAQAVLSIEAPPEVPILAPPKEEIKQPILAEAPPVQQETPTIIPPVQEDKPVTVAAEPPSAAEEAPSETPPVSEEKPEPVEEKPEPVEEKPEPVEEKPEPVEEKPEPVEESISEKVPFSDESLPIPEIKAAEPESIAATPISLETTGAVILKAADYLFGGTFYLSEIIKNRLISRPPDALALTETLLYAPLCNISFNQPIGPENLLWSLTKKKFTLEELKSFLNELDQMKAMNKELYSTIQKVFRQVKGIQATLADGNSFYFDGQLHSIWSTKDTPDDFSTSIYNIKSYINEILTKTEPFVLLQAQGFDTPAKELADFIFALESAENPISHLTMYDHKLNGIDTIHLEPQNKRFYVFGLWPWQFTRYRKVSLPSEFKEIVFQPLNKIFFANEGKVDLLFPGRSGALSLRAIALKTSSAEKIKLAILTNLPAEKASLEEIVNAYLFRWPNPQESFDSFSRRLELFTYTGNSGKSFDLEKLKFDQASLSDVRLLLDYYLKGLDVYVRGNFLPSGYEEKDFALLKERFYGLKVNLKQEGKMVKAVFLPEAGFSFRGDLEFLCNRLNEREIKAQNGLKVWFSIA
ncbi:MAG: hypothetical protein PHN59_05670 [Candidatus Omnitrophica bacterium]|nr:hypothetical protein [Candidatus Omnitrophota bacterium]